MNIRLGNLSPREFGERVGSPFTGTEIAYLTERWSGNARLSGPEDFHIFDSPTISVTVGSRKADVLAVFVAANSRKPFNREVDFDLDDDWTKGAED